MQTFARDLEAGNSVENIVLNMIKPKYHTTNRDTLNTWLRVKRRNLPEELNVRTL